MGVRRGTVARRVRPSNGEPGGGVGRARCWVAREGPHTRSHRFDVVTLRAGGHQASGTVRMTSSGSIPPASVAGHLEPAEIEGLRALIEGRRAPRRPAPSDAVAAAVVELGRFPGAMSGGEWAGRVRSIAVARFDPSREGVVLRFVNRLARTPLALFGRPQRHFNDAVVGLLESMAGALGALRHD